MFAPKTTSVSVPLKFHVGTGQVFPTNGRLRVKVVASSLKQDIFPRTLVEFMTLLPIRQFYVHLELSRPMLRGTASVVRLATSAQIQKILR
jgi:hypothetical protein